MSEKSPGPLLSHLPAIYHRRECEDLHNLLSVLEGVLFGPGPKGLEHKIANIAALFDVYNETLEEDFVHWLGQWVAFTHVDGLTLQQQRKLIANLVPLYAKRGTKEYLAEILKFFTPVNSIICIRDQLQGLLVGSARIGSDSVLERDRPFWFKVRICAPHPGVYEEERTRLKKEWKDRARRTIDLAKPVHTMYQLEWEFEDEIKEME
jgi:phage tail-like protein